MTGIHQMLMGSIIPRMTATLSSDTTDYNLFTAMGSPIYPVEVILTINDGVNLYPTTISNYAFDTGSGWRAGSILIVELAGAARIIGRGGDGGAGGNGVHGSPTAGQNGTNGGPAFRAQHPVIIRGTGSIVGGGGGGGGGGAGSGTVIGYPVGAGGGGGGGGAYGGAGGAAGSTTIYAPTVYAGSAGTFTPGTGGVGGHANNDVVYGGTGGDGGYGNSDVAQAGATSSGYAPDQINTAGGLKGSTGYAIVGISYVTNDGVTIDGPTS